MLGLSLITLASLLVGQIVAHPPFFTLNDDEAGAFPPSYTLPFEMTNPSRVAGGELYQADILLTDEQWESLRTRKAIDDKQSRWTEGSDGNPLVPYIFQDSVNKYDDVRAGLDHWMEHTCINFEETSNTDRPHLQFHIGGGCWSWMGMISCKNIITSTGRLQCDDANGQFGQQISIGRGCNKLGIVVHEVGHAMGFFHEQSRSDRDDYLTIHLENVEDGKANQFEKMADNNYSVPYDYSSNMHYGIDSFTKNGLPTIVTLDALAQELIGSRNGLTHRDKLLANRMYNCTGKWLEKCDFSSDPCLNDGYTGKDCSCICPPGSVGSNCENIVDDYYAKLRNPLSEKISTEKTLTIETPTNIGTYFRGTKFIKWIVPPKCQKAMVTLTPTAHYIFSDCQFEYLNVKTDSSDLVGQKMCSADFIAGVTLTSETGIIITSINNVNYGDYNYTLWTADVTFENIPGCFATNPPTDPPTDSPTEPPTDPPTKPPTEFPTKPTTKHTTPTEAPVIPCTKRANLRVLQKGEIVFLEGPNFPLDYDGAAKCAWKIKAPKKYKVDLTCFTFTSNGKFNLIVNRKPYIRHSTVSSKKLTIKFKSKKGTSGQVFRCSAMAF